MCIGAELEKILTILASILLIALGIGFIQHVDVTNIIKRSRKFAFQKALPGQETMHLASLYNSNTLVN